MEIRTIGQFVEGLCAIPEAEFSRTRVLDEFGDTALDPASVKPYTFFSPACYTRNLVHYCELFEVIAICWDRDQISRIHNHRDQECWMEAVIGRLEIQNYRLLEQDPARKTCRLEPTSRYLLEPGTPAAVDPSEPIRSVYNRPEYDNRAISVHVYSRPFDSCEVYLPEKGIYMDIPLCYTSRYGVLCPGEHVESPGSPAV